MLDANGTILQSFNKFCPVVSEKKIFENKKKEDMSKRAITPISLIDFQENLSLDRFHHAEHLPKSEYG